MIHWRHIVNRMSLTIMTSGQKNSEERPRLREGGGLFTGEKFMWRRPCGRNAVGCSSRADAVDFLQHTPEQWLTVFINGLDNPKNLPLLFGGSEPHLIYSSFGPPVTDPNSISIHSSVLQGSQTWPTDSRQTDRPRYSICSNRPHLAIAVMRPNKSTVFILCLQVPGYTGSVWYNIKMRSIHLNADD